MENSASDEDRDDAGPGASSSSDFPRALLDALRWSGLVLYLADGEGDFGIRSVSPNAVEQTGFGVERLCAETGFWGSRLHPEDRARVLAELSSLGEGRSVRIEYRFRHRDGAYRRILNQAYRTSAEDGSPSMVTGCWMDLTGIGADGRPTVDDQTLLHQIIDHSPSLISMKDVTGHYLMVNREHLRTHRRSLENVLGKTWDELYEPEVVEYSRSHHLEVLTHGMASDQQESVDFGDETREYVTVKFPVNDARGKVLGVGSISTDVTARVHAERELSALNRELEQRIAQRTAQLRDAQEKLLQQERLATLGQVAATVSHELRNPLATIGASTYLLRKRLERERIDAGPVLARLARSVDRCDRIIEELLEYTRLSTVDLRTTMVDDWLGAVLEEQRVPDGVTVRFERSSAGSAVAMDPDLLRRAVINLYENACQAMRDQPELRSARTVPTLTVSTRVVPGWIEIVFDDDGPGIPPDLHERIFEPMFSTKSFGVGLGLAVVKQIAERHRGRVSVGSPAAGGARMSLHLPLFSERDE